MSFPLITPFALDLSDELLCGCRVSGLEARMRIIGSRTMIYPVGILPLSWTFDTERAAAITAC